MWSTLIFDQLPARGKVLPSLLSQGFPGFPGTAARTYASRSQITCATNCATPGYSVFLHDTMRRRKKQVFRVCGQRCGQARFFGSFSTGEFPPQATVPRTSGISLSGEWMSRLSSQTTRATNCANPGYSVFLHDTMPRRKKQVFRVCGRRCGHARFFGSFSTGEFPPQATVPRTSGGSLLGEWMGRLSSQTTRATNCANPGYSVFCMIPCEGGKSKFSVSAGTPDLTDLSRRTGAAAATSLLYRFPAQSQVHSAGDRCSPADRATHIHGSSYITLCILQ